jgi:hypothetical protein
MVERMQGRRLASSSPNSPIAIANAKTTELTPPPQIDSHSNSLEFSLTSTTSDPPTIMHATTTTSAKESSKYSSGVESNPPQQVAGTLLNDPSSGFHFQYHQRRHYGEVSDATNVIRNIREHDEVNVAPKPPPQESRCLMSDMEADGYDTPWVLITSGETGTPLVNAQTKPSPPQAGLFGIVSARERERKHEGGLGATPTEREREGRLAEERQRKLDDFQKQQPEMVQNGSMYGSQFGPGLDPTRTDPIMLNLMDSQRLILAAQGTAAQVYRQSLPESPAQVYRRSLPGSPAPSPPSRLQGATLRGKVSRLFDSLTATARKKTLELPPLPETESHLNSPGVSPALTTPDPPPALTHTATTRSEIGYSSEVGPSPPQQVVGALSSRNRSDPASYSKSHQRQHYDKNSDGLEAWTFLERDVANVGPKPLRSLPPRESGGPLVNTLMKLPPLQTGLLRALPARKREKKPQGGLGAARTERERERRLATYGSRLGPVHVTPSDTCQTAVHSPGYGEGANGKGKRKAGQDRWAESSSLAPVDPVTTSVSEGGTLLAPSSPSYAER